MSQERQLMDELVTLDYDDVILETALLDISDKYNFSFAYSKDLVALDIKVTLHVKSEPLDVALKKLFRQTAIKYAQIGKQIVLKFNPAEYGMISQVQRRKQKRKKKKSKTEKITIIRKIERVNEKVIIAPKVKMTGLKRIVYEADVIYVDEKLKLPKVTLMKFETRPRLEELKDQDAKVAVSVVSNISTDKLIKTDSVVNLSFNIFSGSVANVEGAQVGSFVNIITGDLRGVQVVGGVNKVGKDMIGTQISVISNRTVGKGYGTQITVGANRIENIKGLQVSVFSNKAEQKADVQISVFRNKATTSELQIGLFNRSKNIAKFQIGLINRCDSVSGLSIGLLNFVRHGNNYFEYGTSQALKHNFALKFGGHRLYNILKFSVDKKKDIKGYGYGFGNTTKLTKKWNLDLEVTSEYLLSKGPNKLKLNLFNSLDLDLNLRVFSWFHLYGGLALNNTILQTQLENSREYKYELAPENVFFVDKIGRLNQYDFKVWLGYQFGVRFYLNS